MSDNKFIKRLKGEQTAKSILEVKNEGAKTSFANMPQGTSNAIDVFSDYRGNATAVLNGTTNWKVSNSELLLVDTVSGDGQDFTSTYSVSGTGLWVNASYTFPSTGDPRHPVAMVFNPSTKWVLKVCGDSLIVDGGSTVDFTMLVKIGTSNVYSKNFTIRESAGQFSKEFIIDFGEANSNIVKAGGLSTLTVQLLCGTANASARIYNGMTVLTCLQRKVDASAVSNSSANVEDVLDGNIIPSDYFSNPEFIDQVEDGEDAYAVFTRDGDDVNFSGWTPKEEIATKSELTAHIDDKNNPHEVTKTQVGLGNVDNTSDLNKPISTATQDALDLKANIANLGTAAYTDSTDYATAAQGTKADSALQPGDNVSELVNDAGYLTQHQTLADLGITATATELNYVDGVTSAIQTQIDGKQPKSASAYNMGNTSGGWTAMSTAQQDALNSGATTTNIGQIATNTSNIANEIINRQNADNGLQSQIDAIVSKSDVVDIVGTYAELQAYDTSSLGNNDVVKVLDDSTHNNAPSYYRWVITGGVGAWVYVGSESETYTKAETDALLNAKQDNITATDGITLTGTTLTNSGVRAVASGTANGTISVNTNGTSADVTVTGLGSAAYTNSSAYATAAQGTLANTALQPGDDITDLNNDAGYQTAGDVATAISGKQDTLTAGTNITITGTTISATDTTYSDFTGASAGDAGTHGLVPAPAAGDQAKFLQGDGTWANPTAATAWGNITGTLSDQADLQNALNAKADDNAVVHLTGAETIAGQKTFQNDRMVQEITSGSYLDFYQNIDGDRRGAIRTFKDSNDANHYYTIFGNCGPNAEAPKGLAVHRNASTIWTTAATPESGDNSSKIATTEWVHSAAPNLAMPSGRYTNITTPASGNSIVAPADGYFQVRGTSTAAGQRLNCDYGGHIGFQLWSQNNNQELKVTIPVSKGGSVYLAYNISNVNIIFTYAQGAS